MRFIWLLSIIGAPHPLRGEIMAGNTLKRLNEVGNLHTLFHSLRHGRNKRNILSKLTRGQHLASESMTPIPLQAPPYDGALE